MAPPVCFLGDLNLTLQEKIAGSPLGDRAKDASFPNLVAKAARAIAEVHGADLPLVSRKGAAVEQRALQRWTGLIANIRPDLTARAEGLRDRIGAEIESRLVMTGPVHGDFHLANLLADDDAVLLIDLDDLALGDRMGDVGRFMGALRVSAHRISGRIDALEAVQERFLDAYIDASGEHPRRARLFEAAALMRSATTPFRLQRGDWKATAEDMLDEAERVFEVATAPVPFAVSPGAPARSAPSVDWAAEPGYLRATFYPLISEHYGAELIQVEARDARQDGRLRRLRYRLKGRRDGERWSLDLDGVQGASSRRSVFERLCALHEAARSEPATPILPRPVAYVRELSMTLAEPVAGKRMKGVLDAEFAAAIGRALAALHGLRPDFTREVTLEQVLSAIDEAGKAMAVDEPALAERVGSLVAQMRARLAGLPERRAPIIASLLSDDLVSLDGRVGLRRLDRPVYGPALLDIGDFCADMPAGRRTSAQAEALLDALRAGYGEIAPLSDAEWRAWRALGQLRKAAREARAGTMAKAARAVRRAERLAADRTAAAA